MSARFFIRNDDVWTMDQRFRFFFDLGLDRGLPVVHAVIPGKMDQRLVRFLCRAKEKAPQLLDIVQHGWIHANYSVEAGKKYEFGSSRSLKSQREDIQQGLRKMRTAFGENFTSAFVPPYHGYDECTLRVLHEEGFQVFSTGTRQPGIKRRFIEIPVQVSFSRYEQGQVSIKNANEVIVDLVKNIEQRPLSGVLTHYADFRTKANQQELTRFFDCIAALKAKEGWECLLFSDILSGSKRLKKEGSICLI